MDDDIRAVLAPCSTRLHYPAPWQTSARGDVDNMIMDARGHRVADAASPEVAELIVALVNGWVDRPRC